METNATQALFSDWVASSTGVAGSLQVLPVGSEPRLLVDRTVVDTHTLRDFWQPFSAKGKWLRELSLLAAPLLPRCGANESFWSELHTRVATELGKTLAIAAILRGTPGAYQKFTVLLLDANKQPAVCLKMAKHELAQRALHNEAERLRELQQMAPLHGHVPEIQGRFACGSWQCLALSYGAGRVSTGAMEGSTLQFLSTLRQASQTEKRVADCAWWATVNETAEKLRESLLPAWRTRYQDALAIVHNQLANQTVVMCAGHGDFAPWNMRVRDNRLFVFDWEAARREVPCWFDCFHFLAIQAALAKGDVGRQQQFNWQNNAAMIWLVATNPQMASQWRLLCIAYLLDISLYYASARVAAPDQGEDRVWEWFGRELDKLMAVA